MDQMRSQLYMACKVAGSALDAKTNTVMLKKDLNALAVRAKNNGLTFASDFYYYIISVIENQEELERQKRLDK